MRKLLHCVASSLLIAVLLFSQIGAGFSHDKHDAHDVTQQLGAGQFAFQKHGEHCKVCSLDFLKNLFVHGTEFSDRQHREIARMTVHDTQASAFVISLSPGRAPPRIS